MNEEGLIWQARQRGFSMYFAAYPSFDAQRQRTAKAAREWLDAAPIDCKECKQGIAHDHLAPKSERNNAAM